MFDLSDAFSKAVEGLAVIDRQLTGSNLSGGGHFGLTKKIAKI